MQRDMPKIVARFIPTHVGNTATAVRGARLPAVHPHARGEHAARVTRPVPPGGSSPRTWGTRHVEGARLAADRFIPTHVGNT